MRLNELYEIQGGLMAHMEKNATVEYRTKEKFGRMMLAMMVEFMEAANDWQQFKYWKRANDPKPTLLEEYIDGLHFCLEAGIDLVDMGLMSQLPEHAAANERSMERSITKQFKILLHLALQLDVAVEIEKNLIKFRYNQLFEHYLALGQMLGFTEDQIVAAYMEKNQVNHERQINGY